MTPLGEFIKLRLKEVNMCQIELSFLAQICKSQLNQIINGRRK